MTHNPAMPYFVYMLASKPRGTLYIGVTNNLVRRIHEHKSQLCHGFTARYDVHHLIWFETTESIEAAIQREKQLKNWKRDWKIALIEKDNPLWEDFYLKIL